MCECSGWPDNMSCRNLLAWCWNKATAQCLVIINYAAVSSQARVRLPWSHVDAERWGLVDVGSGQRYERTGEEMTGAGLYVSLEAWSWHFFHVERLV
jgi:hypothetical protein